MKIIKQVRIAEMIEISTPFLNQIISGIRRPSWKVAKRLAQATDTKPELWLDGSPVEIRSIFYEEENKNE